VARPRKTVKLKCVRRSRAKREPRRTAKAIEFFLIPKRDSRSQRLQPRSSDRCYNRYFVSAPRLLKVIRNGLRNC
jgi:hypothetical protein